jgi:pimeloyl-ACP methyl ester carboxylesterase
VNVYQVVNEPIVTGDACFVEPEILTTDAGVEFVRTPDACFENLPDWPYEPQYIEIDGLRQAYVDVGSGESGETILLLHGQPSWAYLYRHMIPVLAEEGHRVIAMDHLGMGRSDKPIDWEYYTYVGHVERLETFIQELELEQGNLTVFVQDWGSLIGLQVVGTNPDWFERVVVGNGVLPVFEEGSTPSPLPPNPELTRNFYHMMITSIPAEQPEFYDEEGNVILSLAEAGDLGPAITEAMAAGGDDGANADSGSGFGIWIDYARNDERFQPEQVVEALTYFDLTAEEEAAYAAPFPTRITMGGVRAFPGLVNQMPGLTADGWEGLGEFEKPFLTIWASNDPGGQGSPAAQALWLEHVPGTAGWDHVRLPEASHFLQDDQGEEIARRINEFIELTLMN